MGSTVFWVLAIAAAVSSSVATVVVDEQAITTKCGFTPYPTLCAQTIKGFGLGFNNVHFLTALINKTISESTLPTSNFETLSYHFISPEAHQARIAIDYCQELMAMSVKRLKQAQEALRRSPETHKADIQTWLSAAITFHQTCKDSVENQAGSNLYLAEIHNKMGYLLQLGSIPLAMANQITDKNPHHRRPRLLRRLLQTTEIQANAVVAKDGSGNYETVSEAIKAADGNRFVIYIKAGTYFEKINTNKHGITLIGDGKYSTIISGSSSVAKGSSLQGSATFTISGDGFIARDIGFHNTAGTEAAQAVALMVVSDHAVLYRCSIAGYQDTLYALSLRQFYRECDIYGTIDFIFGNAAAVFQGCNLVLRKPRGHGAYNVILASGRSDPGQNTGFSIHKCKVTVGSDFSPVRGSYKSYLGRPWREYSRAVVMQSNIDGAIASQGWVEWPGSGGSTYKTLYFAEYQNMGAGGGTSGRVGWPGFHVMGTLDAAKFTVANFIGGNSWLPSTGVTFVSGLQ